MPQVFEKQEIVRILIRYRSENLCNTGNKYGCFGVSKDFMKQIIQSQRVHLFNNFMCVKFV